MTTLDTQRVMHSGKPNRSPRWHAWLAAALAALISMLLTQVPPASRISLIQVPDGLEYAAGAQRIATLGRFDLSVGDQLLPSRYPPSFACLLAPAYLLWQNDFLAGFVACRLYWGIGCSALAFALARRLGIVVAMFVVTGISAHPLVRATASTLMSDAPASPRC